MFCSTAIWHDRHQRPQLAVENPNYFNMDFALMKNTKLTERINVQLRAEFFDVINHPNFSVGKQQFLFSTADQSHSHES